MKSKYYVIVRFEIESKDFEILCSLIESFFKEEVSLSPGFISSRILSSEDKSKVINYAIWESKGAFEKFAKEVVSKSEISKEIAFFNPSRETFSEVKYFSNV